MEIILCWGADSKGRLGVTKMGAKKTSCHHKSEVFARSVVVHKVSGHVFLASWMLLVSLNSVGGVKFSTRSRSQLQRVPIFWVFHWFFLLYKNYFKIFLFHTQNVLIFQLFPKYQKMPNYNKKKCQKKNAYCVKMPKNAQNI